MLPTQTGSSFVLIVVQQRTVSVSFAIAEKVLIPPLSLDSFGRPVASSFLSSILR